MDHNQGPTVTLDISTTDPDTTMGSPPPASREDPPCEDPPVTPETDVKNPTSPQHAPETDTIDVKNPTSPQHVTTETVTPDEKVKWNLAILYYSSMDVCYFFIGYFC